MNPRLRNPLRGSTKPWTLAERLFWFLINGAALLFINIHSSILKRVVRTSTGLRDAQQVPEQPRRIVSVLCGVSVLALLLGVGLMFANRREAIAAFFLSVVCCLAGSWWLRRTIGEIPGATHRQHRILEILRRLWQVIRYGPP